MKFIQELDLNDNLTMIHGLTYSQKVKDKYIISGLYIQENIIIPISTIRMDESEIKKFGKEYKIKNIMLVNRSDDEIVDREILKGPNNIIIDDRIMKVNKVEYMEESYQRLRLELSEYLDNNIKLKDELNQALSYNVKKTREFYYNVIVLKLMNLISIFILKSYIIINFLIIRIF
jgi:hypothetical protein